MRVATFILVLVVFAQNANGARPTFAICGNHAIRNTVRVVPQQVYVEPVYLPQVMQYPRSYANPVQSYQPQYRMQCGPSGCSMVRSW